MPLQGVKMEKVDMTAKNGFTCYEGEPLWFLPPDLRQLVGKMPMTNKGLVAVRVVFTDKRYYDTAVAFDTLIELPDPYTVRDIVRIHQLAG